MRWRVIATKGGGTATRHAFRAGVNRSGNRRSGGFDAPEPSVTASSGHSSSTRVRTGSVSSSAVDEGTVAALRTWRKQRSEERLRLGAAYNDTGLIFSQFDGLPIHPDTVSKLMPRLAVGAGVPAARLYDLRHMHATTLLLAGVPVHVVAARLGHADPAITLECLRACDPRGIDRGGRRVREGGVVCAALASR